MDVECFAHEQRAGEIKEEGNMTGSDLRPRPKHQREKKELLNLRIRGREPIVGGGDEGMCDGVKCRLMIPVSQILSFILHVDGMGAEDLQPNIYDQRLTKVRYDEQ